MSEHTKEFNESNFEDEVLKSSKPVLVDFWAEWCGPCKMLTPVIDGIASEYSDKYSIGKVNVDNNSNIAAKYGIRSIPCLLFFKNGEVQQQIVGAVDKTKIVDILEKL
jgi:thioredoxin 1|tara:strand:- start:560 stop:883 length:324 start_codon:yes stop_codon:yes gene_type:complete